MIFTYGPPGSGKTTVGRGIAEQLHLPFIDLDEAIEDAAGLQIPEIFETQGEVGFRQWESKTLTELVTEFEGVVALGGGALLNENNRSLVEECGQVICLNAPVGVLLERLSSSKYQRPLVNQDLVNQLPALLEKRQEHYNSFSMNLDSSGTNPKTMAWQALVLLGRFQVGGMGEEYAIKVEPDSLSGVAQAMHTMKLGAPIVVVSDENVAPLYAKELVDCLRSQYKGVSLATISPGEDHKTLASVQHLWEAFTQHGLERGGTVVALGGGVVSDLAGFAAGTFLRGVNWVALPTSLLGMVDAAIGGKTGADLPQGKNLIGVFHAPRLVLCDPDTLRTLPDSEIRSGMAEVVKAGVIGDTELFNICQAGWAEVEASWTQIVRRAVAVKVKFIQDDPYERGVRASLNLGHTVGHALEKVSEYRLLHGESVALGMLVEAHLAEALKLAHSGLSETIRRVLLGLNLPVVIPAHMELERVFQTMFFDKKKKHGKLRFTLPVRVGQVQVGIEIVDKDLVMQSLKAFQA